MHGNDELVGLVRSVLVTDIALADAESLSASDDLYQAGLTSLQAVQVLVALEERLEMIFPDEEVTLETFRSIGSIAERLATVLERADPLNAQPAPAEGVQR